MAKKRRRSAAFEEGSLVRLKRGSAYRTSMHEEVILGPYIPEGSEGLVEGPVTLVPGSFDVCFERDGGKTISVEVSFEDMEFV